LKASNSSDIPEGYIEIGKVVGPHGLKGAVRVYAYAESPEPFAPPSEIHFLDPAGHPMRHRILWSRAHKNIVRLLVSDVESRDAAAALAGWRVCMLKKDLPALEPDTYYWSDLIGMDVHTVSGEYLGHVVQIIPTGANDVYVVETPEGYPVNEILIPAIESVVIDIDVQRRLMRVELPEGLI